MFKINFKCLCFDYSTSIQNSNYSNEISNNNAVTTLLKRGGTHLNIRPGNSIIRSNVLMKAGRKFRDETEFHGFLIKE
jgi:hypothetical protein